MKEILLQSKVINSDYIADSSTLDSDNEDSNDKENHDEVNKPQKKKKKSEIEGLSEVIAAMGESRDRFYEKKIDLKEREGQRRYELEEKN